MDINLNDELQQVTLSGKGTKDKQIVVRFTMRGGKRRRVVIQWPMLHIQEWKSTEWVSVAQRRID